MVWTWDGVHHLFGGLWKELFLCMWFLGSPISLFLNSKNHWSLKKISCFQVRHLWRENWQKQLKPLPPNLKRLRMGCEDVWGGPGGSSLARSGAWTATWWMTKRDLERRVDKMMPRISKNVNLQIIWYTLLETHGIYSIYPQVYLVHRSWHTPKLK